MSKLVYVMLALVCLQGVCTSANATVLGFDDITASTDLDTVEVPDGYGGLNWDHFGVLYKYYHPDSGYEYGAVSGSYVAYNIMSYQAEATSDVPFDFNGAYLTSAWEAQNVQVLGELDGTRKYDVTVPVVTTGPTWYSFNFIGVDAVTFISSDQQFVMDNFTYNETVAVPTPGAILLGTLGVGFVGYLRRCRAL